MALIKVLMASIVLLTSFFAISIAIADEDPDVGTSQGISEEAAPAETGADLDKAQEEPEAAVLAEPVAQVHPAVVSEATKINPRNEVSKSVGPITNFESDNFSEERRKNTKEYAEERVERYRASKEEKKAKRKLRLEEKKLRKIEKQQEYVNKEVLKEKTREGIRMGKLYYVNQQYDLAETSFQEVLAIDPANKEAKWYLEAKIPARLKEAKRAEELSRKSAETHRKRWKLY